MKKQFHKTKIQWLFILAAFLNSHSVFAEGKNSPAFDKGSKTLGISMGLGLDFDNYYGSDVTRMPAININYDHGIIKEVGPGTIGIGGLISYKRSTYRYSNDKYKETWTNYTFGVRGTYHLTILKDKNNKFDPYAGVTFGMRINRYRDTYYTSNAYLYNYTNTHPVYGAFVGAKYNFAKVLGVFAELGYDISLFRVGLNLNL